MSLQTFEAHVARLEAAANSLPARENAPQAAGGGRVAQLEGEVAALNTRVATLERALDGLLGLFQVNDVTLQAGMQAASSSHRTACVHTLPPFAALVRDIDALRAVLIPPPALPTSPTAPITPSGGLASPVRQQRVASVIGADLSESAAGVKVVEVLPNGPAYIAGLVPGDVLLSIDGHAITCRADLRGLLASHAPGTILPVTVLRGQDRLSLQTVLGSAPSRPWTPGTSKGAAAARSPAASARRATSPWL